MIAERSFTEEQTRAIERRDGSLLVSAGAGAGKTSVLVERFVRSVLDDHAAVEPVLRNRHSCEGPRGYGS